MTNLSRREKQLLRHLTSFGQAALEADRALDRLANRQLVAWTPRPGGWITPIYHITDAGRAALQGAN